MSSPMDQQRIKKIKQLQTQKRKREKRLQQKRQKQQMKIQKQLEDQQKKIEQQKRQEQEARKQKLNKQHQAFLQRQQNRLKQKKRQLLMQKKIKSQTPLFKRIQNQYNQKIITPELTKKKQLLAEKRQLFSPMSTQSLKQHQKQYLQQIFNKKKERLLINKKEKLHLTERNQQLKYYKPKIAHIIQQEQEIERLKKQTKIQKQKVYAERAKELSENIQLNLKKTRKPIKKVSIETRRSVPQLTTSPVISQPPSQPPPSLPPRNKIKKKPRQKPPQTPQPKKPQMDYLSEQRRKREQNKREVFPITVDWEKIIKKPVSIQEKVEQLQGQTQKLINKTKSYDVFQKLKKPLSVEGIEASAKIDDVYVTSITAKLELLKSIIN